MSETNTTLPRMQTTKTKKAGNKSEVEEGSSPFDAFLIAKKCYFSALVCEHDGQSLFSLARLRPLRRDRGKKSFYLKAG